MKKKIRACITVDLEVNKDFDAKKELAVVQYADNGLNETWKPKSDSFEVLEYVSIETTE